MGFFSRAPIRNELGGWNTPLLLSDLEPICIPLWVTEKADGHFQIEVEFKIHGPSHLHGDGFAMWLTTQRATNGPVFGSADKFEGLGIFFDTYKNNRPGVTFPYVMAMMGDGQTSYDQENDGKTNEIAGCSVSLPQLHPPF